MRMPKYSKRTLALTAATTVAVSGVAFAYWTAGGSGTGTAASGSTVPITVNQTSAVTALAPGLPAQTLSGTFTNTNDGPVYVGTVTVSISSVTKAAGAPAGTCDATDYTVADATPINAEVPSGTGVGSWTGATIQFNNKADVNQDACKGATVNLAYTVS